jgi:hypothetical protein
LPLTRARGSPKVVGDRGALGGGDDGGSVKLRWPRRRVPTRKGNGARSHTGRRSQRGMKKGKEGVCWLHHAWGRNSGEKSASDRKFGARKGVCALISEEAGWGSRAG